VVIVDGNGVLGRYRKLHLYDALGWRESDRVEPGEAGEDDFVVIKVADLHVGVMTCFDLRFPEMARVLCDRGADVLCVPAAWVAGPHKAEVWGDLCRARAIENTSYVVAGAQPAPEFTGCAMVVDPLGVTLASLGAADVGAHALGEASAEKLAEVRAALPLLASRRFDVVPR
jgi:predicted amidohydrolase